MSDKVNRLAPENCNSKKCKTCIFHTDGRAHPLAAGRLEQIKAYLAQGVNHECHTTHRTCYGALEYQAVLFHRMNLIQEPTADCLLREARAALNLPQK